MNNILSYKDFLNEGYPRAFHDPMYTSDVFSIRYRQTNALSNKRASDVKGKPVNDLLDQFGVGDVVRGKCIQDGSYYEGNIVYIDKDERGENISIEIEHDGERLRLAPATVAFVDGGDKGNRANSAAAASLDQIDMTASAMYTATANESELVNIKNWQ